MKKLLLGLVLVAACHSAKGGETLGNSVRAYNDSVRWQKWDNAATFVPPRERSQFIDDADLRAKDLRITDYEVVRVNKKAERVAEVQVKVSWYLDSEGKVHETQATQTWEKHGKAWMLVEEARLRGPEMPGLRERPDRLVREAPSQQ